jgi:hypothetical protein
MLVPATNENRRARTYELLKAAPENTTAEADLFPKRLEVPGVTESH